MTISGNVPSDSPAAESTTEEAASAKQSAASSAESSSADSSSAATGTGAPSSAAVESSERQITSPAEGATEAAQLLDHEYDGILEYDNPMPGWWKNMFWATFVFSLGYLFWFHLGGNGQSVQAAYEADVAEAAALAAKEALNQEVSEESLAQLLADQASLSEAAPKFASLCAPCHADKGQGMIGPNLTDSHWIHGSGDLMSIYNVVAKGVPEKGMPPWERQLSPEELRKVVAFVGSLRGTNVPGKGPEGQPVDN
jgi:cytochrome c oxidase cbb3-type subunit III